MALLQPRTLTPARWLLLAALPLAAQAQEFTTSGFASLVVGKTSGACVAGALAERFSTGCTRYIADWSHTSVYQDEWSAKPESRAGLQASWNVTPQFSTTVQLTTRSAPSQQLNLEWLYASYKLSPQWTLQVGRKRLPLYYYSDFQDIGYAYNTVRTSPDVYGWDVVNYNGASLSHTADFGDWNVRGELLYGSETSKNNPYQRIFSEDRKELRWGGIAGGSVEVTRDWFTGRFSYIRSDFRQTDRATGTVEYAPGKKHVFMGLALNADVGEWMVRTEFGSADRESTNYKARFYLATLGYRMGQFTLTGGLSGYRETSYDLDVYVPSQLRSTLLALRYELHKGGAVKLQWDKVKDTSVSPYSGSAKVLSASYDIVF